jgi:polyisoprenyl-teichoic acid--peptidoglycan teichoic acid transferase
LEYASASIAADPRPRARGGGGAPPPARGGGRDARDRRGRKRRDPVWARLLVVLGALLMLASGGAIVGNQVIFKAASKTFGTDDLLRNAGRAHVSINGTKNILLVGIDPRPQQNATDLIRSDSILILHVPANHQAAYLVSIPRDTYVEIPAYSNGASTFNGAHDKINAAFAYGGRGLSGREARAHGFELLALTIKSLYGITFDAGAIVDFGGFQQVVGVLGGVDMYVDEKTTSIHIGTTKDGRSAAPYRQGTDGTLYRVPGVTPVVYNVGYQHLAPWQALDYVRQRDLLANGDSDYGRQRHQQQFLKAVFKEILSRGVLTNPGKLKAVLQVVGKAMTIDDGGVGIEDWVYAMREIDATDLVTIKTNGGQFNSSTVPGLGAVENLNPTSLELLQAVRDDAVETFVATHPDWVSQS